MPQCRTCPLLVPEGVTRCARCTMQLQRPDAVLKRDSDAYHISLRDEERANYERMAFNYHQYYGRKMQIPPQLYSDMKRAGVDMSHLEANAALENYTGRVD